MSSCAGPVASAAWILARGAAHLHDANTATVIFGQHVRPITRPGRIPADDATLRLWEHSLYISDQWQVNRKLTLSYGTRWEYYPVPSRATRGIERFVKCPYRKRDDEAEMRKHVDPNWKRILPRW